ncbi:Polyubiquitin-B [Artemisia annua]|uniref:Polyubiquitin-B n=1 Tax=Artemisia annua TaxID=35608 RepID=A0A2U1MYI3_ARTAN|nr:Polyubiquitin-B [Artemisia annua]
MSVLSDFYIKKESILTLLLKSCGLMKIYVKALTNETFSLEVKPSDTIHKVKAKIKDMKGITGQQVLFFNEMVLEDSGTLSDFHINKEYILTLVLKSRGLMCIYVKRLVKTFCLIVKLSDTISKVKAKIKDMEGIPTAKQRLVFSGMLLEDNYTLAKYHIDNKSTLHLVVRLGGNC